jgi:hypothetical protein
MLRTHPLPQVVLTLPNCRWQRRMTTVLSSNCGKVTKMSLVCAAPIKVCFKFMRGKK